MINLVALIFGAGIIVVFSHERFNRITYQDSRQLKRLVEFLSPDQLRARSTVLNAFFLYTGALLAVYFFLCAYADLVPILGGPDFVGQSVGASKLPTLIPSTENEAAISGFADAAARDTYEASGLIANTSNLKSSSDIGIKPQVSLGVALIIVGFAPSIPILNRFEDWLRHAAHRFAGIPTEVLSAAARLRGEPIVPAGLFEDELELRLPLVSKDYHTRILTYTRAAEGNISGVSDFKDKLEKVFTISSWIIERKIRFDDIGSHPRFDHLEEELTGRILRIKRDLDELSGLRFNGALPRKKSSAASNERRSEKLREAWEKQATKLNMLAEDVCLLLALYHEHEIIKDGFLEKAQHDLIGKSHLPKSLAVKKSAEFREYTKEKLAEIYLSNFLTRLTEEKPAGTRRTFTVVTWLWTFFITMTFSCIWALLPGAFETAMQTGTEMSAYGRLIIYPMSSFNAYCVPLLAALILRSAAKQLNRWKSLSTSHWTYRLPEAAMVVFVSWMVSTAFSVGFSMWRSAIAEGWGGSTSDPLSILKATFEYNAPVAFLGASLALIILVLLDHRSGWDRRAANERKGELELSRRSWVSSLSWAATAGIIMGILGFLTRVMTIWASINSPTSVRSAMDAIDRGLIFYATLHSAMIGFLVVFCLNEVFLRPTSRLAMRGSEGTNGGRADDGISQSG